MLFYIVLVVVPEKRATGQTPRLNYNSSGPGPFARNDQASSPPSAEVMMPVIAPCSLTGALKIAKWGLRRGAWRNKRGKTGSGLLQDSYGRDPCRPLSPMGRRDRVTSPTLNSSNALCPLFSAMLLRLSGRTS